MQSSCKILLCCLCMGPLHGSYPFSAASPEGPASAGAGAADRPSPAGAGATATTALVSPSSGEVALEAAAAAGPGPGAPPTPEPGPLPAAAMTAAPTLLARIPVFSRELMTGRRGDRWRVKGPCWFPRWPELEAPLAL